VAYSHTGAEATTSSQHRRRTSRGLHAPPEGLTQPHTSASRSPSSRRRLASTPFDEADESDHYINPHMSLDRSPSREREGGWSSSGLTTPYDDSNGRARSPAGRGYGELDGGRGVSWATAKANSDRVNGYPSYQSQSQKQGFFGRHYRQLSHGLPHFMHGGQEDRYAEKEKLGRGRSGGGRMPGLRELPRRLGLLLSRRRKYVAVLLLLLFAVFMWFNKRMCLSRHPSRTC